MRGSELVERNRAETGFYIAPARAHRVPRAVPGDEHRLQYKVMGERRDYRWAGFGWTETFDFSDP
jgi:hypothetical protein